MERRSFLSGISSGAALLALPSIVQAQQLNCVNDIRMKWPLDGAYDSTKITLAFGANWVGNGCDGRVKKHTGIDYVHPTYAKAGAPVYSAYNGVVKILKSDSSFGPWITIEHGGGCWTTCYWHVSWLRTISVGSSVKKGQQIGKIFDLSAYTQNKFKTHLHFGYRARPYSNVSNRGGLPQTNCGISDPAFPEYFVNPRNLIFS